MSFGILFWLTQKKMGEPGVIRVSAYNFVAYNTEHLIPLLAKVNKGQIEIHFFDSCQFYDG